MATMASTLLRAARKASVASRAAAAAASRAAAMASRSARAASVAEARAARILCLLKTRGEASTKPCDDDYSRFANADDMAHLPDDAKTPTDKDLESDEALRSLYERWCKAHNKERDQRDPAEMACRFKLFRRAAEFVHNWNTYVPADPEDAAMCLDKRREAKLLLSKGQDVSHLDECYLPMEIGPFADGGDPYFNDSDRMSLKSIEEKESQTLNEMN